MKLPPGAIVADAKVRDYLLNPDNVQNRGKVALFGRFGFTRADWPALAQALRGHAIANDIVQESHSRHGTKFVVRCHLASPDGRNPCLTSVWIIDVGDTIARLVTAY